MAMQAAPAQRISQTARITCAIFAAGKPRIESRRLSAEASEPTEVADATTPATLRR
jgi:hypothetical protein